MDKTWFTRFPQAQVYVKNMIEATRRFQIWFISPGGKSFRDMHRIVCTSGYTNSTDAGPFVISHDFRDEVGTWACSAAGEWSNIPTLGDLEKIGPELNEREVSRYLLSVRFDPQLHGSGQLYSVLDFKCFAYDHQIIFREQVWAGE